MGRIAELAQKRAQKVGLKRSTMKRFEPKPTEDAKSSNGSDGPAVPAGSSTNETGSAKKSVALRDSPFPIRSAPEGRAAKKSDSIVVETVAESEIESNTGSTLSATEIISAIGSVLSASEKSHEKNSSFNSSQTGETGDEPLQVLQDLVDGSANTQSDTTKTSAGKPDNLGHSSDKENQPNPKDTESGTPKTKSPAGNNDDLASNDSTPVSKPGASRPRMRSSATPKQQSKNIKGRKVLKSRNSRGATTRRRRAKDDDEESASFEEYMSHSQRSDSFSLSMDRMMDYFSTTTDGEGEDTSMASSMNTNETEPPSMFANFLSQFKAKQNILDEMQEVFLDRLGCQQPVSDDPTAGISSVLSQTFELEDGSTVDTDSRPPPKKRTLITSVPVEGGDEKYQDGGVRPHMLEVSEDGISQLEVTASFDRKDSGLMKRSENSFEVAGDQKWPLRCIYDEEETVTDNEGSKKEDAGTGESDLISDLQRFADSVQKAIEDAYPTIMAAVPVVSGGSNKAKKENGSHTPLEIAPKKAGANGAARSAPVLTEQEVVSRPAEKETTASSTPASATNDATEKGTSPAAAESQDHSQGETFKITIGTLGSDLVGEEQNPRPVESASDVTLAEAPAGKGIERVTDASFETFIASLGIAPIAEEASSVDDEAEVEVKELSTGGADEKSTGPVAKNDETVVSAKSNDSGKDVVPNKPQSSPEHAHDEEEILKDLLEGHSLESVRAAPSQDGSRDGGDQEAAYDPILEILKAKRLELAMLVEQNSVAGSQAPTQEHSTVVMGNDNQGGKFREKLEASVFAEENDEEAEEESTARSVRFGGSTIPDRKVESDATSQISQPTITSTTSEASTAKAKGSSPTAGANSDEKSISNSTIRSGEKSWSSGSNGRSEPQSEASSTVYLQAKQSTQSASRQDMGENENLQRGGFENNIKTPPTTEESEKSAKKLKKFKRLVRMVRPFWKKKKHQELVQDSGNNEPVPTTFDPQRTGESSFGHISDTVSESSSKPSTVSAPARTPSPQITKNVKAKRDAFPKEQVNGAEKEQGLPKPAEGAPSNEVDDFAFIMTTQACDNDWTGGLFQEQSSSSTPQELETEESGEGLTSGTTPKREKTVGGQGTAKITPRRLDFEEPKKKTAVVGTPATKSTPTKKVTKMSPLERRLEDRARFAAALDNPSPLKDSKKGKLMVPKISSSRNVTGKANEKKNVSASSAYSASSDGWTATKENNRSTPTKDIMKPSSTSRQQLQGNSPTHVADFVTETLSL